MAIAAVCALSAGMTACSDEPDAKSIFVDENELNPAAPTYQLDYFLENNFREPYNVAFYYKMKDVLSNRNYNLTPAEYQKSVDLAVLCKYLWFDVYQSVVEDKEFLAKYGPRIIHLIGSPAINAANGTELLGTAEGGIMITLYKVNYLNPTDFTTLNEWYFETMHHEFAHVLHQTKTYPKEFDSVSVGYYDALNWQDRSNKTANMLGFVTSYASSEAREDFAETIARYITMTDKEWNTVLANAAASTETAFDAQANILTKLDIARNWFRDSWGMDLDALRAEVQKRQNELTEQKMAELRAQVYDIPVPAAK